jgi:hypothetical protein
VRQGARASSSREDRLRLAAVVVGVALLFFFGDAVAVARGQARRPQRSPRALAADVLRALTDYRAALVNGLPAEEAAAKEAREALEERRDLHAAGALPREYVDAARRQWEVAERDLAESRAALEEADRMIGEATVQNELRTLPALRAGGYQETATLVRFNGATPWSLRDVPKLQEAFERSFGRRLPISALGQTALHTLLGFDHQNAVDVAVHPDSAEGRWLMSYLRAAGVPFIAARTAVAGSSTGAHLHVGQASGRTAGR